MAFREIASKACVNVKRHAHGMYGRTMDSRKTIPLSLWLADATLSCSWCTICCSLLGALVRTASAIYIPYGFVIYTESYGLSLTLFLSMST